MPFLLDLGRPCQWLLSPSGSRYTCASCQRDFCILRRRPAFQLFRSAPTDHVAI